MTQASVLTLLGILVAALSLLSAWQWRLSDKREQAHAREIAAKDAVIERRDLEVEKLREANLNFRFAVAKLSNTSDVVDRLLSIPVQPGSEGSGT
jgi:hypothetical protein